MTDSAENFEDAADENVITVGSEDEAEDDLETNEERTATFNAILAESIAMGVEPVDGEDGFSPDLDTSDDEEQGTRWETLPEMEIILANEYILGRKGHATETAHALYRLFLVLVISSPEHRWAHVTALSTLQAFHTTKVYARITAATLFSRKLLWRL